MNRLLQILIHPLSLTLLIGTIIIWILPPIFDKFKAELVDSKINLKLGEIRFYHDFDHDGNSEFIRFGIHTNTNNLPFISVEDNNGAVLDDWPIKNAHWVTHHNNIFFGDCDKNGYDEVYCLTYSNDSVFLNGLEPIGKKGFIINRKFITKANYINNKLDIHIYKGLCYDLNNDGYAEVVFSLIAGYGLQPRAIYSYNIVNDSINRTPLSGFIPEYFNCMDINNDGFPEIFGSGTSKANYHVPVPFTDWSSWLMVYNNGLNFLFEPIEFRGFPSSISTTPIEYNNQMNLLVTYVNSSAGDQHINSGIYSLQGELVKSIDLNKYGHLNIPVNQTNTRSILFEMQRMTYYLYELNDNLNLDQIFNCETVQQLVTNKLDLNNDGLNEYIFKNKTNPIKNNGELSITDENLKNELVIDCGDQYSILNYYSVESRENNTKWFLSIQQNDKWFKYSYEMNPVYYYKYLIYTGIYLLLFLFFHYLLMFQKKIVRKRMEVEKMISRLQFKTIKNQLDPHFALNTLNAIGSLIGNKDIERANYLFSKYSKLTRDTLTNANNISITLREELTFVRDYLELEVFRHQNQFEYSIEVNEHIVQEMLIPRMLVHTFAENAVKHGLIHLKKNGILTIKVAPTGKGFNIEIADNGVGRQKAKEFAKYSTGKGLGIINEMINLYNKLNKTKISFIIADMNNEKGECEGTQVNIYIPS